MRTRIVPFALVFLFVAKTFASATCNPSYVKVSGPTITVLPTNIDDTANLQCAFDLGSTIPGVVLQLTKGTYITGRIVADGFVGTLRGMGMDATMIRNPDYPIYVTPDDFEYVLSESSAYAPPYLFVFLGGDYTVTELTVSIVGTEPATDWSIFGIRDWLGHGLVALGHFTILGSPTGSGYREANAKFYHTKFKGQVTNDPFFGSNVNNAIIYQGFAAPDLVPLKGRFTVTDSVFEAVASANPVINLRDSGVTISGNTYRDVLYGAEVADLTNTLYQFSHSQFVGFIGVDMLDECLGGSANCGFDSTYVVVKNNVIRGVNGVALEGTFANGTKGLVLGNNVAGVSDLGVFLGSGSNHSTVVGTGPGTVVDLGVNNSVTGMTKAPSAQGPQIKSFLRLLHKP